MSSGHPVVYINKSHWCSRPEVGNEGHIYFCFSCQLLVLITELALTFRPPDILAAFLD
uniref:Uncharacterized protein n=1 Tax=Anguilla anguilla TaxID=7936 RepID=A0A0E9W7X2_ANGAN